MAAAVADSTPARVPAPLLPPAAAVLTCVLGALTAIALPFVGIPLAAGSLAVLWYRGSRALAVVAALMGGAATMVFGLLSTPDVAAITAVHTALWLLVAGPLTAAQLRTRPVPGVMLLVAALSVALMAGVYGLSAALAGQSVEAYVRSEVGGVMEPLLTQALAPTSGAVPDDVSEQVNALLDEVVRMWPSAIAVEAGLTALLAVALVSFVAVRSGISLKAVPRLEAVDLSPHVLWPVIGGVALVAADKFTGGWSGGVLGTVGENVLRTMQWVLFVQGLAVFAALYRKVGLTPRARAFGFVLLGLTEVFLPIVSVIGLADLWVNLRKLPRDGRPGGAERSATPEA